MAQKIKRYTEVRASFVSLEEITHELAEQADTSTEPYEVLRRKTKNLASLLECSEAEAERLILERM